MTMEDLYEVFRHRLAAGVPSLHPHRWLAADAFNYSPPYIFDCRLQRLSLFDLVASHNMPIATLREQAIYDADQGRKALRALGRQAGFNIYRAHPLLADQYHGHRPSGVGVQDAVKDFLVEHIPQLRLEVRTPVGAADGLTPKAVLEVARLRSWKQGLGQLCAYALHFPGRRKILVLFGSHRRPRTLPQIRWTCRHYQVHVGYICCDEDSLGLRPTVARPARQLRPGIHTCGPGKSCCYELMDKLSSPTGAARETTYRKETDDAVDLTYLEHPLIDASVASMS
jgi:hypothetical protein